MEESKPGYRPTCRYRLARQISVLRRKQAGLSPHTTYESRLLRTSCSRSRRQYLQSGLSPYLQILACPTNIRASAQASRTIAPHHVRKPTAPHFVLPQSPPVSAIRAIALLADTGLPDKYPCFGASKLALSPAACRGFLCKKCPSPLMFSQRRRTYLSVPTRYHSSFADVSAHSTDTDPRNPDALSQRVS